MIQQLQFIHTFDLFCHYIHLDLDECVEGTHDCDENAVCTNTPEGSFTCACSDGYTDTSPTELGDGRTCEGILFTSFIYLNIY